MGEGEGLFSVSERRVVEVVDGRALWYAVSEGGLSLCSKRWDSL